MRKITYSALTDVGMKRKGNEDAFIVAEEYGLYVVCDGMGGHASGEVASAMTADEMVAFMQLHEDDGDLPYEIDMSATGEEQILSNSIQHANDKVYVAGMKDAKLEGMGTTVVALQEVGNHFVMGHVGDSRIYRLRNGELSQLTRDHSLLNHKIDIGELSTDEEIRAFKHGNIIVRAIGLKDYVQPETGLTDRQPGDVLLLCSDGLTDLVDDWTIENVIIQNVDDLDHGAQILIRMANDRGGKDNITVLLVRIDDEVAETSHEADADEIPLGISRFEETTEPSRDKFDPDDDDEDDDDYDFEDEFDEDDEPDEERTKPHQPAFDWDEDDDDFDDSVEEDNYDDDEITVNGPMVPPPIPPPRRAAPQAASRLPSIMIEEDEEDLPSIIIED